MRLKPVTEGAPQHAGGCPGRATLHHKMLTIKKVRGIPRIKRARAETVKRRKHCARPFPTVAQQIMHTKGAGARGVCANWTGIPMTKIEIPVQFRGLCIAPRITPLLYAFWNAVRRAMELFFRGKTPAKPLGIGGRFRVADVYRPFHGQTDVAEHAAIAPQTSFAFPEGRMADLLFLLPGPIISGP